MGEVPTKREREIPEGVERKPLRVHKTARDYISQTSDENGRTVSQELNRVLPANWDEIEFGYENDEIAYMKVTPATKNRVKSMSGKNVSQGDVVTMFVMLAALENDDLDVAADLAVDIPTMIWDVLNDLSESILQRRADDD